MLTRLLTTVYYSVPLWYWMKCSHLRPWSNMDLRRKIRIESAMRLIWSDSCRIASQEEPGPSREHMFQENSWQMCSRSRYLRLAASRGGSPIVVSKSIHARRGMWDFVYMAGTLPKPQDLHAHISLYVWSIVYIVYEMKWFRPRSDFRLLSGSVFFFGDLFFSTLGRQWALYCLT